jgi:hypothetical protein
MAKRGRKDCENCNTEIGSRSLLCDKCGYHYPSGKVRPDLLAEKNAPKEAAIYKKGGRGRKQCPECNIFIGAVTKICPKCDFDFSTIVKVEKKQKHVEAAKKEGPSLTDVLLRKEAASLKGKKVFVSDYIGDMNHQEHAERILGYGKARATNLLMLHRTGSTWGHVNWKIVEEGLAKL